MALEQEQQTYERELPKLLSAEGKYALIKGDAVAGTFDTYPDALKAGYDRFGLDPFLVKPIRVVEQVQFVRRDIVPCPT